MKKDADQRRDEVSASEAKDGPASGVQLQQEVSTTMKYVFIVAAVIGASCIVAQAADGCKPGLNGMTFCARGNMAWGYDASGRHIVTGVRRGNVQYQYDASGRVSCHLVEPQ
jgi:hypothetical protein